VFYFRQSKVQQVAKPKLHSVNERDIHE